MRSSKTVCLRLPLQVRRRLQRAGTTLDVPGYVPIKAVGFE